MITSLLMAEVQLVQEVAMEKMSLAEVGSSLSEARDQPAKRSRWRTCAHLGLALAC